jgi:hypothetical protein
MPAGVTIKPYGQGAAARAPNSRTSGETLLSLICDILDFSRIEAQKLLLEERPFNLEDALERALQICCMTAAKKRINVTCSVDDGTPRHLIGDVGRLQQVLLNALGNSLKFTPDRGVVQLRCGTVVDADGQRLLHIAVMDSGIGISPAGLAKLFASFSQVDSSPSRKYDGAGLGLAISRRLCEAMGGTMRAESPGLGCGSTFHVTLKLKEAPASSSEPVDASCTAVVFPTLSGRHFLIADACTPVCSALAQWLRAWGVADVVEANTVTALETALARGAEGGAPWDGIITEASTPFLQAVLTHLDGAGPACAQDTCADSGGAPGIPSELAEQAPRPLSRTGDAVHATHVFALAWPAMPLPVIDLKFPGAPRAAYGACSAGAADGLQFGMEPADGRETSPQDLVASCVTIVKPVRQSRLREALVAAFGADVSRLGGNAGDAAVRNALAMATRALQASGRPLHASNSMASFASCGDVGDCAPTKAKLMQAGPPLAAGAAAGANMAVEPPAPSLCVMLAEDHLINQKVVVSLLNRYGHKVACVANDGLDALHKLRATPGGPSAFDGVCTQAALLSRADRHVLTRKALCALFPCRSVCSNSYGPGACACRRCSAFFRICVRFARRPHHADAHCLLPPCRTHTAYAAHGRHRLRGRHRGGVAQPQHAHHCGHG